MAQLVHSLWYLYVQFSGIIVVLFYTRSDGREFKTTQQRSEDAMSNDACAIYKNKKAGDDLNAQCSIVPGAPFQFKFYSFEYQTTPLDKMPRLHLSEKNTSNGRGSAMSNIQNIQPRAPRRSLSSSSRAADGKESTHTSDMDLFDFDEFDYNDYGNGGDDIGGSDAVHGDKLKDENCTVKSAEQTPAPPRTTDALSLSKKKTQSQPPPSSWSPSSSSSGNGSETLAQLSKRTKSNHNPTRKRKNASREFVSPTRRVVPTVSSQKITVSSLSKNNHAPNKKRESTKNYINNNNNKGNASNNTTVATKKQNDENKVNQSTIITANGKNHDSLIRSRKKNSQTSQQQKKQKTVKFQQQNEKKTKKKSGVLAASGKKGNKPNSSRAKQPQDLHDSDSSNDGLEDTDDEEPEKNEKQAISTNSSSKANANRHDDSNTRSNYTFHKQQIQVLPLRAIAIDNRALPTFVGDAMARSSFLSHIPEFVEGALEKGVLSASSSSSSISGTTIVAAFKHSNGAKDHASCDESVKASHSTNNTRTDSPGRNSVVAHTAYLCESRYSTATHPSVPLTKQERALWVSEFLRPVNHGFVNDSGMNPIIGCGSNDGGGETSSMDSGAIKYEVTTEPKPRIPDGFHARDSWDYLGSLGENDCILG